VKARACELDRALMSIRLEVERAEAKYPPFNSPHEGYAVIAEELDELWDAVKADDRGQAKREAVQVGAMAVRFLRDITATVPRKGDDS